MGFVAYDNRLAGTGVWTDTAGTFVSDPPIDNLGTPQVPSPHAEFEGDTGEFSFAAQDNGGSADNFTVRLLALLGHTLPDGASVTFKDESDAILDAHTVARFKTRPNNLILLLDADETIHTLKCEISGAGTGTHRIASAFAGPAKVYGQSAGTGYRNQSDASVVRIGGTDWPFVGTRRRGLPVQATGTRGEVLGVNFDGTEYSGTDWVTLLETAGQYGQVIVAPSSKTQKTIDALAIYGLLDSVGEPEHVERDIFRIGFRVLESR